ncbi:MAG: hypothetical protein IJV29_13445 [Butyrivibrio sp.]|nr:hypothetical protein [Butyrivibrio sp.]
MTESKKNKRKRRVLAASCILAALIVAGSTFAWFTSKDEVVNKLSAKNNYDVVAVESFTPPDNWTPGQKVTKEVGATNTGNVDAFVKATLTGNIVLKNYTDSEKFTDGNKADYVELSTGSTPVKLPDTEARSKDEVKAIQAGGRLVYSPETTGYSKDAIEGTTGVMVAKTQNGTLVGTDYEPNTTGYYIFARSTEQTSDNGTTTKVTYDGYYFVKDATNGDKYYAIDITPDSSDIYKITTKVKKTKQELITADKLNYVANEDNSIVYAYYNPDQTEHAVTWDSDNGELKGLNGDEIIIDIAVNTDKVAVDNSKDWKLVLNEKNSSTFKNVESEHNLSFYYNKLLVGGTTAPDVIKSITLDSNVNNAAYLSLDYNLKVTVDSAQVVDDRSDSATAVTAVNTQEWAVLKAGYNAETKAVTWSDRTGS